MGLMAPSRIIDAALAVLADGNTRSADAILTEAQKRRLLGASVARKHVYTALSQYIVRVNWKRQTPEAHCGRRRPVPSIARRTTGRTWISPDYRRRTENRSLQRILFAGGHSWHDADTAVVLPPRVGQRSRTPYYQFAPLTLRFFKHKRRVGPSPTFQKARARRPSIQRTWHHGRCQFTHQQRVRVRPLM